MVRNIKMWIKKYVYDTSKILFEIIGVSKQTHDYLLEYNNLCGGARTHDFLSDENLIVI